MNIDIHHVKSIRMNDKRTSTLDDGREFTSQKVVIEYLDLVDTSQTEHGWVTCTTEMTLFMSDGEEKNIAELLG